MLKLEELINIKQNAKRRNASSESSCADWPTRMQAEILAASYARLLWEDIAQIGTGLLSKSLTFNGTLKSCGIGSTRWPIQTGYEKCELYWLDAEGVA